MTIVPSKFEVFNHLEFVLILLSSLPLLPYLLLGPTFWIISTAVVYEQPLSMSFALLTLQCRYAGWLGGTSACEQRGP